MDLSDHQPCPAFRAFCHPVAIRRAFNRPHYNRTYDDAPTTVRAYLTDLPCRRFEYAIILGIRRLMFLQARNINTAT